LSVNFSGAVAGGLSLLSRVTADDVSAVDFTDLPSGLPLLLQYWDLRNLTGGENINLRFSEDNGSSFVSTTNYGRWLYDGAVSASNSATEIALSADMVLNASARVAGQCWFYPLAGQSRVGVNFQNYQADAAGNYEGSFGSGLSFNPSGEIDAFRVFASAGNLSGEFRLFKVKS
jgi:hypothetical protein